MPFIQGRSTSAFGRPLGLTAQRQPFPRQLAGDVEGAALGVTHECHAAVLVKPLRLRQIHSAAPIRCAVRSV